MDFDTAERDLAKWFAYYLEHGGDPASIEFFASAGFDYVSCSPYRVPVARLAAAHAVIGTAGDTR